MSWKIDIKGIVEPFSALRYIFKKPLTFSYPHDSREIPKGYRGWHINDEDKCIGCGLCEDVCMNVAIDMIKPVTVHNEKNGSGLIPRIDYGRCCWCSLCTDVCPTKSLNLTPECIMVSDDPNSFLFDVPNRKKDK